MGSMMNGESVSNRKNALIKVGAFLLALLLLAGCSSGNPNETKGNPAKTRAFSETEKPTDSAEEETKPAESTETEHNEPSTEGTMEKLPADIYREAVSISEENHYGEKGAYGIFDHQLTNDPQPALPTKDQVFLYFSDREYYLEYETDSEKTANISLHSGGQNWTTTYMFYPSAPMKKLHAAADSYELANAYAFALPNAGQIEEAPEQDEYNGIPCWCFTVTGSAASTYPEGSVARTRILFRQEDLIFVYARRDVVTPDGTEIPMIERRILSAKETEDFYQTHAQIFADVERRDSGGDWTLTMVFDPGEINERTARCPMNAGEELRNRIAGYTPYLDREGTKEANLDDLSGSATDATIYLIRK